MAVPCHCQGHIFICIFAHRKYTQMLRSFEAVNIELSCKLFSLVENWVDSQGKLYVSGFRLESPFLVF